MTLNYLLLDVFTEAALAGNPLAVVLDADGLDDARMQAIAKEFNLSETVFFQTAKGEGDVQVRIFTPTLELPFAGHPTVGSAVVLGLRQGKLAPKLEEKVGLVHAQVARTDHRSAHASFILPRLSEPCGAAPAPEAIAEALSIDAEDIGCGLFAPAYYSAGVPFYLVPVRDPGVLARLSPNPPVWRQAFPEGRGSVYIFTQTPDEPENDLAARMFAPGFGMNEDPGTGAAAAALTGLLADKAEFAEGVGEYRLRQGLEMGRLCRIALRLRKQGGRLVEGAIGGNAVIIAEGVLDLD